MGTGTYPVLAYTLNDVSNINGRYFSYIHAKLPNPLPNAGKANVAVPAKTVVGSAHGHAAPGAQQLRVQVNWPAAFVLGAGSRAIYSPVTARNDQTFTVAAVLFVSSEDKMQISPPTGYFLDTLFSAGPARLAPGQTSTGFTIFGAASFASDAMYTRTRGSAWAEAVPYPDANVWRFYNMRNGSHFYTADPGERDAIVANLGWLYAYEGPVYSVIGRLPANGTVLWRLWNRRTGTHFYTADPNEKDSVLANLGAIYALDGPAYYVSLTPASEPAATTVWRFYNKRTGSHFYTIDPAERDSILANLGWLYAFDGPAFYLAKQ